MSQQTIQAKFDKAHTKIGKVLGSEFTVYSPLTDINPIDDRNIIGKVQATFTVSDQYTKTIAWDVPIWTVYTDPTDLSQGDFLSDGTRTFFILSRIPLLPVLAVECPDTISINSVSYGDSGGGFAPGEGAYTAHNVPCFITTSSTSFSGNIPGSGVGVTGFRKITAITFLRAQSSLIGMTVSGPNNFTGDIINYDFASLGSGVKFTAQEFQQ